MSDENNVADGDWVSIPEAPESFDDQLKALEIVIAHHRRVSFAELTPFGRQAALALIDDQRASLIKSDGRMLIGERKPRRLLSLLTLGLAS